MAESKPLLKHWSEFLSLRQKKVNLFSPITLLLGKYLYKFSPLQLERGRGEVRFRQGIKDGTVMQSCHMRVVIFTDGSPGWLSQYRWLVQQCW